MTKDELSKWHERMQRTCNDLADKALAKANDGRASRHSQEDHMLKSVKNRNDAHMHRAAVILLRGLN